MKNILKIFSASVLCSSLLLANSTDDLVINYEKNRVSQNPNVKVLGVSVNLKKPLEDGWYGYILDVEAQLKASKDGKTVTAKDVLFSNGKYIALDLINPKNGKSYKSHITPNLTSKYYNKSKLIAGNHDAKDKIVVFSDPLCPFCMDYIPDVINYVNKNSDKVALYYYHFPLLRIHPAAGPLSKIMEVAKHKGLKDLELKVYEADWDKYFDSKSTDEKKILEAFNSEFKTNITLEEIQNVKVQSTLAKDMQMGDEVMVQGTPTIFVNGQKDNTREKYLMLGK